MPSYKTIINSTRVREYYMKLNCLSKNIDYDWFRKYSNNVSNQEIIKRIPDVVSVLNDVFPNQWEFHAYPKFLIGFNDNSADSRYRFIKERLVLEPMFVIKFDKINITNSKGHKSIIHDLYVMFKLGNDDTAYKSIMGIFGTRGKLAPAEYDSGYAHSHLNGVGYSDYTRINYYRAFCLGEEGIRQTLMMLDAKWSIDLLKMAMIQLKDYVSWESLEGGPHRRINAIKKRGVAPVQVPEIDYEEYCKICELIDESLQPRELKVSTGGNGYCVHEDDIFEDALVRILPEKYHVFYSQDGNAYPVSDGGPSVDRPEPKTCVVWKNKRLEKIEILPDNVGEQQSGQLKVHDVVFDVVIDYLRNKTSLIILQSL